MSYPPLDELRADLTLGINRALAGTYGEPFADMYGSDVKRAVDAATEGWEAKRVAPYQHPLLEHVFGHQLVATLPPVLEMESERDDREARMAARRWRPEDGPPPPKVGIMTMLGQTEWWRMVAPEGSPAQAAAKRTTPVRIEDMEHDHRLNLLAFLRRHAGRYKNAADWSLVNTPFPGGEMAGMAFEAECDRLWDEGAAEWLERQPLVCALVAWTTPWAESPLTWRPPDEAPKDGRLVMVIMGEGHPPILARRLLSHGWAHPDWTRLVEDEPECWRELRPDEVTELAARFGELRKAGEATPGWRLMSEAPRDGTIIIVRWAGIDGWDTMLAYWSTFHVQWCSTDDSGPFDVWPDEWREYDADELWRPMDEAPQDGTFIMVRFPENSLDGPALSRWGTAQVDTHYRMDWVDHSEGAEGLDPFTVEPIEWRNPRPEELIRPGGPFGDPDDDGDEEL